MDKYTESLPTLTRDETPSISGSESAWQHCVNSILKKLSILYDERKAQKMLSNYIKDIRNGTIAWGNSYNETEHFVRDEIITPILLSETYRTYWSDLNALKQLTDTSGIYLLKKTQLVLNLESTNRYLKITDFLTSPRQEKNPEETKSVSKLINSFNKVFSKEQQLTIRNTSKIKTWDYFYLTVNPNNSIADITSVIEQITETKVQLYLRETLLDDPTQRVSNIKWKNADLTVMEENLYNNVSSNNAQLTQGTHTNVPQQ